MNRVFLMGDLPRAPDQRHFPDGKAVVSFTVRTARTYHEKTFHDYLDCLAFGQSAEAANALKAGDWVVVEGSLQSRSWDDSGKKRWKTEVVVQNLQPLTSPSGKPQ